MRLEIEITSSMRCTESMARFSISLCGIFYFPWHRHQVEGTSSFLVSLPNDTGKVERTNVVSKRQEVDSNAGPLD